MASASPLLEFPAAAADLRRVEQALLAAVSTSDPLLTEVASHLIKAGGKRIRPVFCVAAAASADAEGRPATEEAVKGGVAVELVHLGSLYHDDVMDDATTRRTVQSVNARWGNLKAILAGDFLLARASEIAASLGTEVAGLLAATIGSLCEGQIRELRDLYNPDRSEADYLTSIEGKTAVLFATACRVGGIVGGLPRPQIDAVTEFGREYGVAFQIVDDVLDMVSTAEQLGKPAGHDLVEGVYTLPVIRFLASADGDRLRSTLGKPLGDSEREKARDLVSRSAAVGEAVAVAREHIAAGQLLARSPRSDTSGARARGHRTGVDGKARRTRLGLTAPGDRPRQGMARTGRIAADQERSEDRVNPSPQDRTAPMSSLLLWVVLSVLVIVLGACSDDSDDGAPEDGDGSTTTPEALEPVDGGSLTFAVEADSDGYNPVANRWSISGNYVGSSFLEPLVVENGDGTVEPWLAVSVTPNEDGTEWTIVLRDGITFHDGTPLDAEAVAANIEARKQGALTASSYAPVDSWEVTDPTTVVVTMNRPWAAFDHVLASAGFIIAPAMIADPAADPVGTGPFRFTEWVPDSYVTVERNDDYWREPAHLDEIRFEFLPDLTARKSALDSGSIDAMITFEPQHIIDYHDSGDVTIFDHSSEPYHVLLNRSIPPFDDPVAREAIALGSNPEALITALGGEGLLQPATSPFVPSNPWHLEDNGWPSFDQDRARELVTRYEQESGEDLTIRVIGSQGGSDAQGRAMVEQWAAIGVDAEYVSLAQSEFLTEVIGGEYQAALWRSHNWVDPDFNYIFWHSSEENAITNFTRTANDDLDAALDQGRESLDPEVRREAYDQVQLILNEELTHVWLYDVVWALVSQPEVHGWEDLEARGMSRLEPKVFYADLWMEP